MSPRPRRLDIGAMTARERSWNLVLAAFATGLIGWLNGAATVDWNLLLPLVAAGRPGPVGLAAGLLLLLALLAAGTIFSWRTSHAAFMARAAA